jgi:hypothetical protein
MSSLNVASTAACTAHDQLGLLRLWQNKLLLRQDQPQDSPLQLTCLTGQLLLWQDVIHSATDSAVW